MPRRFPYPVTDQDYWISYPLEGLNATVLRLGMEQQAGYRLNRRGIDALLKKVSQEKSKPCKYCREHDVHKLFVVLKPQENYRLLGFIVCEACNAQFKADVAA